MSITHITEFEAAENQASALHTFLQSLIPYISSSQGCISCEILRCTDDASRFVAVVKWDCVESHRNSVEGYPKEDMQAAMSLFGAPPKAAYYETLTSV